ncbi:hypothetical protein M758_1G260900 [Ceratodon purpureus]|nr:hypothetical protein M758_1G260900 [Ceratodon purpureus]
MGVNLRLSMALRFLVSLLEKLRRMYETYLPMPKLSKSHGVMKVNCILLSLMNLMPYVRLEVPPEMERVCMTAL